MAHTTSAAAFAVLLAMAGVPTGARAENPCAAKANPCAAKMNPCSAKPLNPCAAEANPCAAKSNPCNPCGANPCNPCGAAQVDPARFKQPKGVRLASGGKNTLIEEGEKLWNDRSLGQSGLACANCHIGNYSQMNATFAKPYPHYVAMPHQSAGVSEVNAAEMVNFCMIVPMMSEPLPWSSPKLAEARRAGCLGREHSSGLQADRSDQQHEPLQSVRSQAGEPLRRALI
jgi:hypothetical protein